MRREEEKGGGTRGRGVGGGEGGGTALGARLTA